MSKEIWIDNLGDVYHNRIPGDMIEPVMHFIEHSTCEALQKELAETKERLREITSEWENACERAEYKKELVAELALRNEIVGELVRCSGRVIYQATEASLQMPENKIVSMASSDLEKLRALGLAVHELNEALASAKAKLKGE